MDTLALTFHLEMNVVPMKMLAPDMFASMDEFIEHAAEYRWAPAPAPAPALANYD